MNAPPSPAMPKGTHFLTAAPRIVIVFHLCHFVGPIVISSLFILYTLDYQLGKLSFLVFVHLCLCPLNCLITYSFLV